MAIPVPLKLKHRDIGALSVFCLIGLLAGCFISDTTWSVYTSALVADHLFLGWLVFMSDERVKRTIPVFATVGLHLAFVVLVVILVAARHSIPHFGLLPFALIPVAIWLLSSAAGSEVTGEEPMEAQRPEAPCRTPERQLSKAYVQTRLAMRAARVAAENGMARFDPANRAGKMWPMAEPSRPVAAGRRGTAAGLHAVSRKVQPVQIEVNGFAPQPVAAEPQPAPPMPESQPQWAVKVLEALAAAAASAEAKPAAGPLLVQPAINGNGALPPAPALQTQPVAPTSQARPETPKSGYKQTVAGIELPAHYSLSPDQPAPKPVLLHDIEIATSLRRCYSDEDKMFNPILAATAEEHEEWLADRATFDPTHRKPGTSVKEQYEEWLRARVDPGMEPSPQSGQAAL